MRVSLRGNLGNVAEDRGYNRLDGEDGVDDASYRLLQELDNLPETSDVDHPVRVPVRARDEKYPVWAEVSRR